MKNSIRREKLKKRELVKVLNERKRIVSKIIEKQKDYKEEITQETVRASHHKKGYQYYYKEKPTDKERYLKTTEKPIAKRVVQNEYNHKLYITAKKELKLLDRLLAEYSKTGVEELYQKMPEGKRLLVTPIEETDEEFLINWLSIEYETLKFLEDAPELYSTKGIRMRSKSEIIIANLLEELSIPYRYEKPLFLKGVGYVHPDFTLLDIRRRKEIYLEHLGMLDEIDYMNSTIRKIRSYEKNGYYLGNDLLITGETKMSPLDVNILSKKLKEIFEIR